jgi:hypothetical protein
MEKKITSFNNSKLYCWESHISSYLIKGTANKVRNVGCPLKCPWK